MSSVIIGEWMRPEVMVELSLTFFAWMGRTAGRQEEGQGADGSKLTRFK